MMGLKLNIGCGRNIIPGWHNLDAVALPGVDTVADLNACRDKALPFEPDSVDEFLASHVIEHISNVLDLMEELHRIAKLGAKLVVRVPYGSSDDAWEDPTHVRAYFLQSFGYYSQPFFWRASYDYRGDWRVAQIELMVERAVLGAHPLERMNHRLMTERNVVREMVATLYAVKPIREAKRELQDRPEINFVPV